MKQILLKLTLLLCGIMVGSSAWAETKSLTFDLTSNPGGWPTANSTTLTNYTYTLNSVSYTFALNNVKCNSGYLMLTSTAVLGLPAIDGYKLTKVEASNSNGCSTSTKVGISSSSSTATYISGGAIQTWSTQGSQYTYTLTGTEANTMYYMYVTNKNAQVTSLTLTYESTSSSAAATTTTIDDSGITNTDVYVSTEAGSLSASVTADEEAVAGATVTWSSSNTSVATINASTGAVTLVAAGTTTITASYAGDEDYQASSDTYELTVTSSAPYVQPTEVEFDFNYEWLGSNSGSNLPADKLPVVKTQDNVQITITAGTSTQPRGDADYIRVYTGSTIKFEAPDNYLITEIVFTTGGNNTWNAPAASVGTLSEKTWTGEAEEVTFTLSGSCFLASAVVTLDTDREAIATNIDLDEAQKTLSVGDMDDFVVSATVAAGFTGTVTYTFASSDASVVEVAGETFSAEAPGTATITITANPTGGNASSYKAATQDVVVTVKGETTLALSANSVTPTYGTNSTVTATVAEGYDGVLTANSNNDAVATVSVDGTTITVTPVAVGTATITVTAPATSTFDGSANASINVTVGAPAGKETAAASGYSKVTSTSDFTDGEYLIVCESQNKVFNGSLSTLDGTGNFISVTITNSTISSSDAVDAATFTISSVTGGYSIKSKGGHYIGRTANSNGFDEDESTVYTNTISFSNGNAVITGSGGPKLQYFNSGNNSRFRYYASNQTAIALYKKTSITATLNAAGYATFCSEYPLDFSDAENYTAWQVTAVGGEAITFSQVTGNVEGGTGLLLKGEAGETVTLTSANSTTTLDGNLLQGLLAPTYIGSDEGYGLSGQTFVKINGGTMPAGKAYLPASAVDAVGDAPLRFVFEEATGIDRVETAPVMNGKVYDLSGREVQNPTRGLYIVNGKKVYMK